jgi:hypothetical protein
MRRVIIESPFAGATPELAARNLRYLRACLHDCLQRGEAPFASHSLYTQEGVLRDDDVNERALGIKAGFAWRAAAHATVVYEDLGVSHGMRMGIEDAKELLFRGSPPHEIEYRSLGGEWKP